ncbi:dynein light chain [Forsythia ovata]|uniref:Dynein light chain n=1 Tax=Forsythia ovata TaxID=205694 RepID=A0ABD1QDM8_9LAMI
MEVTQTHCKQKQKQVMQVQPPPPPYRRRATVLAGNSPEEVKLAAVAISLNVRLRSAQMPFTMQERALRHARSLLGSTQHRANPTPLALSLKKEFDSVYGPAWHCVVGKSFGSFVTYSPGGFVYFSIDSLSFLLFKTEVHLVKESSSN